MVTGTWLIMPLQAGPQVLQADPTHKIGSIRCRHLRTIRDNQGQIETDATHTKPVRGNQGQRERARDNARLTQTSAACNYRPPETIIDTQEEAETTNDNQRQPRTWEALLDRHGH